jgi:aminopeptidase N
MALLGAVVVGAGTSLGVGSPPNPGAPAGGSFDVTGYDITMDYQPDATTLHGVTEISATATGALDTITLHLSGPAVRSVTVDSAAVTSFSQVGEKDLVIVPATTIGRGSFRVRVEYAGTPGGGWLPTTSGGATAFHGSSSAWFPEHMTLDVIVHEQAHQWYGVSVAPLRAEDRCLSECFATYAAWMWEEAKDGVDLDARYRAQVAAKKSDPAFWEELYQPGESPGINIYGKGPLALHALRRQVGDEAFDRFLEEWPQSHRDDYVEWPRWEAFAANTAGQDLTGFHQAWFRDGVVPADEYLRPGALKP